MHELLGGDVFVGEFLGMYEMRGGLLLLHRGVELRGDAPRVRLPRMHNWYRSGGYILVVHGPCGDAIQQPDVLGDRDYLRRSWYFTIIYLSIRSNYELQLGRLDERRSTP